MNIFLLSSYCEGSYCNVLRYMVFDDHERSYTPNHVQDRRSCSGMSKLDNNFMYNSRCIDYKGNYMPLIYSCNSTDFIL